MAKQVTWCDESVLVDCSATIIVRPLDAAQYFNHTGSIHATTISQKQHYLCSTTLTQSRVFTRSRDTPGASIFRSMCIMAFLYSVSPRPAHPDQSHSAAGTAHRAVPSSPAGACSARTTPPPASGIASSPAPRSSTSDGAIVGRFVHRRSNTGGTPAKSHQTQWFRHEAA